MSQPNRSRQTRQKRTWPSALHPAAILAAGLLALAVLAPEPGRAVEISGNPPEGRWTTFASGDDILDLAVDGDTIWAGTRAGGLVRWRWQGQQDPSVTQFLRPQDPIGGNTVRALAVDIDGHVWMATDGGLTVLDDGGTDARDDDRWQTWTVESSFGGLPGDRLTALAVSEDKRTVWVGGEQRQDPETGDWTGGGVGRLFTQDSWDPSDDSWAPIVDFASTYRQQPDGSETLGLVSNNITAIAIAPGGFVWFATGPHWLEQAGADPEAPPVWQQVHGGLSRVDSKGTIDPADDSWSATSCENTQLTVTCQVQTVAIDPHGRGWAAIGGRGLIHFDPALAQVPPPVTGIRLSPPPGEGDPFVLDIAFGPAGDPDLANTLWLGTRHGGLAVLDHKGAYASPNQHEWNFDRGAPFDGLDGLASDRVQAVAWGRDRAWLGSGPEWALAAGVRALDPDSEKLEPRLPRPAGPASNFITDIQPGPAGGPFEGQVWVATGSRAPAIAMRHTGAGLSILTGGESAEAGDDQWVHHDRQSSDDDGQPPWTGIPGDNLQAIAFQGDRAWLGAMSSLWDREAMRYLDGGLALWRSGDWTRRGVDLEAEAGQGLVSGSVSSLAAGCQDGELWLGTGEPWEHAGRGLQRLRTGSDPTDLGADAWTHHAFPDLASDNVTAIAADCAAGKVWVGGTHHSRREGAGEAWVGGGAAVYDLATERWARHLAEGGLEGYAEGAITGAVLSLATTETERVWAGGFGTDETTAGQLIAERPLWPAVLNERSGQSWEHEVFERAGWISALAVDGQGRLWAGSSRGGTARDSAAPESWREDAPSLGGLFVREEGRWSRLDPRASGLPANDISSLAVDPEGQIWLGTEGWGMARFEPGGAAPTATPTSGAASPTPSPTSIEPTPTPVVSLTPVRTARATATGGPTREPILYLPWLAQRRP